MKCKQTQWLLEGQNKPLHQIKDEENGKNGVISVANKIEVVDHSFNTGISGLVKLHPFLTACGLPTRYWPWRVFISCVTPSSFALPYFISFVKFRLHAKLTYR